VDGIDYFVTGGGGKVRSGSPGEFEKAFTVGWAAAVHFLLVKISGRQGDGHSDRRGRQAARGPLPRRLARAGRDDDRALIGAISLALPRRA
jgi:hypothetical protein